MNGWIGFSSADKTVNSAELPQLLTLHPTLLSFQTNWIWFPRNPCTYLDMSPLLPGNSSFHFWIYILSCRHKSSFQDCCGKSNALGNFWDWHIRPHLVSRYENPDQGGGRSKDRGLQTGDSLHVCHLMLPNTQTFPFFKTSLAVRHDVRINSGQLYAHTKRWQILSRHNDHWLQKWLSSFSPPCVHTLGWGSYYTTRPCHSSL